MSSTRKSLKPPPPPPPRPSGRFEDIKAAKETYSDLTYQIRRLNELYNQLTPQNGNRRASSSSSRDHQDGAQRDPKALQQLRELKANLRKDYGHPRDIPRLERLKVVVMFDDHKKPFFDIRLRPFSGYPRGYPFLIDDSEGTIAGLSVAIYQKVLRAVQEEGEEEGEQFRDFGEGNHNHNDRHAAEDLLEPVNIKQEIVDEEEEEGEELITLEDDSEEEPFNNELQQEENYNSQVVIPPPAATDNSAAIVMPENGPAALANHPQANIDVAPSQLPQPPQLPPTPQPLPHNNNNNSSSGNNNNNTAEQQRQQSAVSGSTVSQGQSSEAPSIKLEPADSSIVNIGRVSHPPSNQAPQTGHNEAPASFVAVPPPPPAAAAAGASPAAAKESSSSNIRVLLMNPPSTSNTNVGPPTSKPQQQQQQQLPHPNNNNNSNNITKTSAQQLQQQPPAADVSAAAAAAAAAAVAERRTLTMTPTANSSIFHIVGNNKRPGEHSNAAQPAQPAQDNPKRPKVAAAAAAAAAGTPSSSTSTSTQASKATLRAIADRFLASAAFLKAADTAQLPCPICEKKYAKAAVKDHMDMLHLLRFQYVPYHCTFAGCTYFNVWELNALSHVKQVHGCRSNPEQYLVKRAAGAAAGAAGAVVPRTPGASGSAAAAAAAKRVTTTTTTPTTAVTTSTPSTASTTHQQHRPSSTSTPTTAAAPIAFSAVTAANVEEYLRASCPDYVAARGPCTKVKCPRCSSTPERRLLKDHVLSLHRRLKPYHCRWEGCSYATGWQSSATRHLKEVHKSSRQAEFIVFQEEEE